MSSARGNIGRYEKWGDPLQGLSTESCNRMAKDDFIKYRKKALTRLGSYDEIEPKFYDRLLATGLVEDPAYEFSTFPEGERLHDEPPESHGQGLLR